MKPPTATLASSVKVSGGTGSRCGSVAPHKWESLVFGILKLLSPLSFTFSILQSARLYCWCFYSEAACKNTTGKSRLHKSS